MDSKRIPIFFTFDDNYVYPAAVAFYSLLKRARPGVAYDMFVLHHDITPAHQKMLSDIVVDCGNGKLSFVNTEGFLAKEWAEGNWDEEKNGHRFTVDTIVICFAARLFPQYDKIICSDVDVVFQDDISELWEVDLEDKYLAAVRCVLLKHHPQDRDNLKPVYREKLASTYFVTGIVVFNLKKMREDGIEEKMMEIIRDPTQPKRWPDQDILNIACDNNVKYLPLNYFAYPQLAAALRDPTFTSHYSRDEMYDSIIRPKIIHYAGFKPWNTHTEWEKAWWDIADYLKLPVNRPSEPAKEDRQAKKLRRLKRWSTIRALPLVPLALLMPRNRRKIVFGGWAGRTFSCNPKYLMEYFAERGGFKCVWIGGKHLKDEVEKVPHVTFAAQGSLAALWHMLTAKFYVYNVCWWTDLMRVPRCGKTTLIFTSHGVPTKFFGVKQFDGRGRPVGCPSVRGRLARIERFMFGKDAWNSATSPLGRDINLTSFVEALTEDRMIACGTPRFDYLIHNRANADLKQSLKRKYARILGVSPDARWFLYMPTWRHDPKDNFSFVASDRKSAYQEFLAKENAVLIELHHFITLNQLWPKGVLDGRICLVATQQLGALDVQELVLASDRLITDYSSVYYDAYVAGRPVIHFAHDFKRFMTQDMGFNYDVREFAGGPLAYSEDDLLDILKKDDTELLAAHGPRINEILEYEKGHACEGYYDLISDLSKGRKPK